jgi:hypothetical protein
LKALTPETTFVAFADFDPLANIDIFTTTKKSFARPTQKQFTGPSSEHIGAASYL